MANSTDSEIIKAFEEKVGLIGAMEDVYLDANEGYALYEAMDNALDLINSQRREIEKLQKEKDDLIRFNNKLKRALTFYI